MIERVENATGPDRDLDHDIAEAMGIVALVERELPELGWDAGRVRVEWRRPCYAEVGKTHTRHETPALALLLAFLRAKASGENSGR